MKSNKAKILYKNITTYTNSNYAKFLNFHNDKYEFSYNFYTIVMSILLCYCIIINIKSKSNTPANTTNSIFFLTFPDIRRQAPRCAVPAPIF